MGGEVTLTATGCGALSAPVTLLLTVLAAPVFAGARLAGAFAGAFAETALGSAFDTTREPAAVVVVVAFAGGLRADALLPGVPAFGAVRAVAVFGLLADFAAAGLAAEMEAVAAFAGARTILLGTAGLRGSRVRVPPTLTADTEDTTEPASLPASLRVSSAPVVDRVSEVWLVWL